jgi:hypothetical protein
MVMRKMSVRPWYWLPALVLLAGPAAADTAHNAVVIDFHQGRLILGWMGLWLVAVLTFAVCADKRMQPLTRLANYLEHRSQQRARQRADNAMRELAIGDPRMVADMVAADDRADRYAPLASATLAASQTEFVVPASSELADTASRPVPVRGFRTTPFPGLPRHLQYLPG